MINPVIKLTFTSLIINQLLDKSPYAICKILLCNVSGVVIMLNQCTQREQLLKSYTIFLIGACKEII